MLAREQAAVHKLEYDNVTKSYSKKTIKEWTNRVLEWEADTTKPDPYYTECTGKSNACLRT